jgi:hypothetical protein
MGDRLEAQAVCGTALELGTLAACASRDAVGQAASIGVTELRYAAVLQGLEPGPIDAAALERGPVAACLACTTGSGQASTAFGVAQSWCCALLHRQPAQSRRRAGIQQRSTTSK